MFYKAIQKTKVAWFLGHGEYLWLIYMYVGTSDPYVKFKVSGKTCYRSRTVMKNLNPRWDEKFSLMLDDLSKTIDVRVYDYDRGLRDDSMGGATIQPSELPFSVSVLRILCYSVRTVDEVND